MKKTTKILFLNFESTITIYFFFQNSNPRSGSSFVGDILTFSDPSKRKGDGEEEDEDEYELPFYFFEPLRWLGRDVPKNRRGWRKNGNQSKKILCAGVSRIHYFPPVFFQWLPPPLPRRRRWWGEPLEKRRKYNEFGKLLHTAFFLHWFPFFLLPLLFLGTSLPSHLRGSKK